MSDGPTRELYEELFAAARKEAAPETTRRRIAQTLASRSRLPLATTPNRRTSPRARLGLLFAAAALGAVVVMTTSRRPQDIEIVAESPAPSWVAQETPAHDADESAPSDAATERTGPPQQMPAPTPTPPKRTPPAQPRSATTTPTDRPKSPGAHSTLEQELGSVQQARAALSRGDAQTALAELDHFGEKFGWRQLSAESSLLRIEALTSVGRKQEAQNLARRFVEQHPNNPLVDRARKFVGDPNLKSTPTTSKGKQP